VKRKILLDDSFLLPFLLPPPNALSEKKVILLDDYIDLNSVLVPTYGLPPSSLPLPPSSL
jgi:hypothetical protein